MKMMFGFLGVTCSPSVIGFRSPAAAQSTLAIKTQVRADQIRNFRMPDGKPWRRVFKSSRRRRARPIAKKGRFSFHNSHLLAMLKVVMGKRREARERAVQFLFQYDLNP